VNKERTRTRAQSSQTKLS